MPVTYMNIAGPSSPRTAVPVLFSASLPRTESFYRHHLDFLVHYDIDHLALCRGNMELRIYKAREVMPGPTLSLMFRVEDLDRLHFELMRKQVVSLGRLKVRPCGRRYFSLTDCDGHELHFIETARV